MGGGASSKAWLWRPEGDDDDAPQLSEQVLSDLFSTDIDALMSKFFGSMTFTISPWTHLSGIIEKDPRRFIDHLQDRLDGSGQSDIEFVDARLHTLMGYINPSTSSGPSSWFNWLPNLEPHITLHLNHDGVQRSRTQINVPSHSAFVVPPLPSLTALGLQEQMDALKAADIKKGGSSFALRLSHSYVVTQYQPPYGPVSWESELVLLRFRIAVRTMVVVQLSWDSRSSQEEATKLLLANGLNGDFIASVRCKALEFDSLDKLVDRVIEHYGINRRKLRMVLPHGQVVNAADAANLMET